MFSKFDTTAAVCEVPAHQPTAADLAEYQRWQEQQERDSINSPDYSPDTMQQEQEEQQDDDGGDDAAAAAASAFAVDEEEFAGQRDIERAFKKEVGQEEEEFTDPTTNPANWSLKVRNHQFKNHPFFPLSLSLSFLCLPSITKTAL